MMHRTNSTVRALATNVGMTLGMRLALSLPFAFTGELKKAVIKLGRNGLAAADQKAIEEAARQAAVRE